MVYPYMTLADGTEIVHTQVFEEDGVQKVEVHFERPTANGFDTARCQLPTYASLKCLEQSRQHLMRQRQTSHQTVQKRRNCLHSLPSQ